MHVKKLEAGVCSKRDEWLKHWMRRRCWNRMGDARWMLYRRAMYRSRWVEAQEMNRETDWWTVTRRKGRRISCYRWQVIRKVSRKDKPIIDYGVYLESSLKLAKSMVRYFLVLNSSACLHWGELGVSPSCLLKVVLNHGFEPIDGIFNNFKTFKWIRHSASLGNWSEQPDDLQRIGHWGNVTLLIQGNATVRTDAKADHRFFGTEMIGSKGTKAQQTRHVDC